MIIGIPSNKLILCKLWYRILFELLFTESIAVGNLYNLDIFKFPFFRWAAHADIIECYRQHELRKHRWHQCEYPRDSRFVYVCLLLLILCSVYIYTGQTLVIALPTDVLAANITRPSAETRLASCSMFHFPCLSCYLTDPSQQFHIAPDKYSTMHHLKTEMCTQVHILVMKWCIFGCGSCAVWGLRNKPITYAKRRGLYRMYCVVIIMLLVPHFRTTAKTPKDI